MVWASGSKSANRRHEERALFEQPKSGISLIQISLAGNISPSTVSRHKHDLIEGLNSKLAE
jgi:hypothetical protein